MSETCGWLSALGGTVLVIAGISGLVGVAYVFMSMHSKLDEILGFLYAMRAERIGKKK